MFVVVWKVDDYDREREHSIVATTCREYKSTVGSLVFSDQKGTVTASMPVKPIAAMMVSDGQGYHLRARSGALGFAQPSYVMMITMTILERPRGHPTAALRRHGQTRSVL